MLFRRNKPIQVAIVSPPTHLHAAPSSSHNASGRPPARTLEEILGLSVDQSGPPVDRIHRPVQARHSPSPTRAGHTSEYQPPRRHPGSKKTGYATIHTDATDTHAAFESDAFAVHMPTTRIPILEQPVSPIRKTHATQVEAYRTYEEKARQVRARNSSQVIRGPPKIVSYDYARTDVVERSRTTTVASPSVSPPAPEGSSRPASPPTPAGAYPVSPLLPRNSWEQDERPQPAYVPISRTAPEPLKVEIYPRKRFVSANGTSSNTIRHRKRADSEAEAPRPAPIKVTVKPKPIASERLQVESSSSGRNRTTPRTPSPVKTMPSFTRNNSVEGDSLFGYEKKDGIDAVASDEEKKKREEAEKEKEKITTRWPWLRPRFPKPTTTPVVFSHPVEDTKAKRPVSEYIDPFTQLPPPSPTITAPSPPSLPPSPPPLPVTTPHHPAKLQKPIPDPDPAPHHPTKLQRPNPNKPKAPAPEPDPTPTADPTPAPEPTPTPESHVTTGFSQLSTFALFLLRMAFYIYVVIAIFVVLDALREAVIAVGAPFRALKELSGWMYVVVVSAAKIVMVIWAKWGVSVVLGSLF